MAAANFDTTMCQPIACLVSASGSMLFFTTEAVKVWVDMEASLRPNVHQEVGSASYEGFSLQQWVSHAKKKSAIASTVCKMNGELKARLSKSARGFDGSPGDHVDDPLVCNDPWAGQMPRKLPEPGITDNFTSIHGLDMVSSWVLVKGTKVLRRVSVMLLNADL